ncbi:retention module-containing protein, partial [Pseudomonas sp.]|uniref:retention module-containing protein n=1 Tax=Pseudomonas sp. TaxID=306 RepID=UPI0028A874AA
MRFKNNQELPLMSSVIAIVKSVVGQVFAVSAEGARRLLVEGDHIFQDDQVLTGPAGMITLEMNDGRMLDLGRDTQWSEQTGSEYTQDVAANEQSVADLQQAIAAGADPTQAFEPTAAGPTTTGTGAGNAGGGHSFVVLDATAGSVDPTIGYNTTTNDFAIAADDAFIGEVQPEQDVIAPVVSIALDPITSDDVINRAEADSDTITLTGTVGGDVRVGDTITLNIGGVPYSGNVVQLGNGSLGFSIDVSGANLAANSNVTATVTSVDGVGNVGTATTDRPYTVDLAAEASITLDPITDDSVLNNAELSGDTLTLTGTVGGDAQVGDTVTLTIGSATYTGDVIARDDGSLGFAIDVPTGDLRDNASVNASITVTDAAGNTASANDDQPYSIDTQAEASIVLDPITDDSVLNNAELSGDTLTLTGTVGGDAQVGDTVTLTIGSATYTGDVIARDDGSLGFAIDVPTGDLRDNASVNASITVTDAAGNTASANDTENYSVDTDAPTLIVDIAEPNLAVGETTTVTFTFSETPVGFTASDISSPNGTLSNLTQDPTNPALWTATFTPDANFTGTVTVSVPDGTYTDTAGNAGTGGSDTVAVDTDAPTLTVDIAEPNLAVGETTTVTFTFSETPVGFTASDISSPNGTLSNLTQDPTNPALWTATFTPDANFTGTVTVSVPDGTYTDTAGNAGTGGSDTVAVDTDAPTAPTVTIVDDNNPDDGQLTTGEIGTDGVQVSVQVSNAELVAGGSVTLEITNGTTSSTVNLSLDNGTPLFTDAQGNPLSGFSYDNGTITFTESAPPLGSSLTVEAIQTDLAGNESAPGSDTAIVVNTPPDALDDISGTPYTVTLGDRNLSSSGTGYDYENNRWNQVDSKGNPTSIVALNADGSTGSLYQGGWDGNANAIGVDGTTRPGSLVAPQTEFDPTTGKSEAIVLNFSGNLDSAQFTVAHLIGDENGGEVGRWVAMYNGAEVASGTFQLDASNTTGYSTFGIDTGGKVFDSIRFESLDTAAGGGDGSDYFLAGFSGSGSAALNSPYTLDENGTLAIANGSTSLLANDSDADGDAIAVTAVNGQPLGGTITLASGALLTVNADGSFSYNPNGKFDALTAGQVGKDSFIYTISDGHGGTDTATATITIIGTNDAPLIAGDDTGAVVEDAAQPVLTDAGTLTIADADAGQSVFQTTGITASSGALGSL